MEDTHRHFVQFMLHNGIVTLDESLEFLKKIDPDRNNVSHLKLLIVVLNRHISSQHFKIVITPCEVTDEEMVVWINMKNDDLCRLQNQFTQLELEYFNALMKEITESEYNFVTFPFCLNITSTLTDHFSRDNGDKVLKKWFKGGYFIKKGPNVYLGPRTIQEFSPYLRGLDEQNICALCSELNFVGEICTSCYKKYHSSCLKKYFQSQTSCPNCKEDWHGTLGISSQKSQESEDTELNSDDGSMDID